MRSRFPSVRRFQRLVQLLGLLIAVGAGSLPLSVSTAQAQVAARPWSWATTIQHPTLNGYVHNGQTATDAAGNQYITGAFQGKVAFGGLTLTSHATSYSAADVFVAKRSAAGQWLWVASGTGSGYDASRGVDIAVDAAGTATVLINCYGGLTLGSLAVPAADWAQVVVARVSAQGQWLRATVASSSAAPGTWPMGPPGGYPLTGLSLAVDAQGTAYVAGQGSDLLFFGTDTLTPFGGYTGPRTFVASLGTNGQWNWATYVGTSVYDLMPAHLAASPQGGVWVAGSFEGATTVFGATVLTNSSYSTTGHDIFVARLSAAGQWQAAYAAGGLGSDYASALTVDAQDNVYVAGSYYQRAAFGADTLVTPFAVNNSYSSDGFIAKLTAAGQWAWARTGGSDNADYSHDVALDAQGEVYWTGNCVTRGVFGPTNLWTDGPAQAFRGFFAKLSPAGQWRWTVATGSYSNWSGSSLAPDPQDGMRVAGTYAGPPALGSATVESPALANVLTAHLTAQGQWTDVRATESGGESSVTHIVSDAQGNTYATGSFGGTMTFGATTLTARGHIDGFVACTDRQGQPRWVVQLGTRGYDFCQRLALDPRGGVVVTGSVGDSLRLGADVVPGGGSYLGYNNNGGFVARISAQGQVLSGVAAPTRPIGLAVSAVGEVVLGGTFADTLRLGSAQLISRGGQDAYVARLSATNQWQWARQIGGVSRGHEYFTGLALDPAGDTYLTGSFSDTLALGATTLITSWSGGNTYLARLSAAGQWQWAQQPGGTSPSPAAIHALTLTPDGAHLFATGSFVDSLRLGSLRVLGDPATMHGFGATLDLGGQWLTAARTENTGGAFVGPAASVAGGAYVLGGINGVVRFGADSVTGPTLRGTGGLHPALAAGPAQLRAAPSPTGPQVSPQTGPPLPPGPLPFVASLSGTGQWTWGEAASGAQTLASDPAGDLFVGGTMGMLADGSSGYVSFDSTYTCGAYVGGPTVLAVGFVTAMLDGPLGLSAAPATSRPGLEVWPNPAHRTVRLRGWPVGATTVRVLDAQGRVVYCRALAPATAAADETLTLPPLEPGLYLIECGGAHQRLVVE